MSDAVPGTLRRQDRRALTLGAIALVAMLGYARVARPAFDQLTRDEQALAEQKDLLARERALLAIAPSLPHAQRDADRVLAAEQSRLFAGDSVAATAALTSYAADVASAAGVKLSMVEGRAPVTRRGLTRLMVDMRGEGSWRQVLSFVRVLESAEQLVDVATLRLERGPRGGPLGGDTVTLFVTIAGYSRSAP